MGREGREWRRGTRTNTFVGLGLSASNNAQRDPRRPARAAVTSACSCGAPRGTGGPGPRLASRCTPPPATGRPSGRGRLSKALRLHFEESVPRDARRLPSLLGPRGARHRVASRVRCGASPARPRSLHRARGGGRRPRRCATARQGSHISKASL